MPRVAPRLKRWLAALQNACPSIRSDSTIGHGLSVMLRGQSFTFPTNSSTRGAGSRDTAFERYWSKAGWSQDTGTRPPAWPRFASPFGRDPYVSPGVTRVISRRLVVLGSPRTWVRAVLGGVVIRFLGLFPRFVGFLLSCSHVLFIDLFHGAFPLMFHRYDFAPDPRR
jgi:hypothetical protein